MYYVLIWLLYELILFSPLLISTQFSRTWVHSPRSYTMKGKGRMFCYFGVEGMTWGPLEKLTSNRQEDKKLLTILKRSDIFFSSLVNSLGQFFLSLPPYRTIIIVIYAILNTIVIISYYGIDRKEKTGQTILEHENWFHPQFFSS